MSFAVNPDQLITLLTFTVSMIIQVGLPCYYGDRLFEESTHLSMKAFSCGWYKLPASFRKELFSVMLQANKPIQFKALQLLKLNLETFSWVSK